MRVNYLLLEGLSRLEHKKLRLLKVGSEVTLLTFF